MSIEDELEKVYEDVNVLAFCFVESQCPDAFNGCWDWTPSEMEDMRNKLKDVLSVYLDRSFLIEKGIIK